LLCQKLLINTRLEPGAKKDARSEKPFKRFFVFTFVFTALKRGVNEMISTEQAGVKTFSAKRGWTTIFVRRTLASMKATAPGMASSAGAVHAASRRWLGFFR
jgi:hypothetical protein